MATTFIDGVIGKLGGMAGEKVANEACVLLNFREDFEWLQNELTKVKGYLQYAHGVHDELGKKWLLDVQEIAYDAEDIVDECDVEPLYRNFIQALCICDSLFFRYKMGRRIRKLKDKIELVMKDAANLKLVKEMSDVDQPSTSRDRVEKWKKSSLKERDAKPVAIPAKVKQIIDLLENDALQVIAVVGMGGIGKTFLLQNVYNDPWVKQKFQIAIWLSISQFYSVERLQSDIASHLGLNIFEGGHITVERAQVLIHDSLIDKRSLIVLDDVWRVEGVENLIQRLGIPNGTNNSCKVVVTTRNKEVCTIMRANLYNMELMSEQDSWNLFCLHAFPEQNKPCQKLQKVAHLIQIECHKLPLAIKTVAASMANVKLLRSWESKLQQLREVSGVPDPIMPILRLSYDALPAELKPCFLYFSFFGEDEEIDAEYLIYLWIQEGFIPEGKDQWSIGWTYLEELKNLCLVEESEDGSNFNQTCKIHDLLLDLIISISAKNNCAYRVEEVSSKCRCVLLAKKGLKDADICRLEFPPSLRTLSLSKNTISVLPTKSLGDVRALRVIDLKYTLIDTLPKCIGSFKLLRVLTLNNSPMEWPIPIPDCVRNLKSLRFLDARQYTLSNCIGDLKCLQYLHVNRVDYSGAISREISKLLSLLIFRSEGYSYLVLNDIAKLTNLQELGKVRIENENEKEKSSMEGGVLEQLVKMRNLTIEHDMTFCEMSNVRNYLSFPENMKAMQDLEQLDLNGFSVPIWICEYKNLRTLTLSRCDLSQNPPLGTIPNLMHLSFKQCLFWEEVPESFGKSGAFPQLRILNFWRCWELKKLPDLQDGAMPCLETFRVSECVDLQTLPDGFEHLRSFKTLDFLGYGWTREARAKLQKIKANNPHVHISTY